MSANSMTRALTLSAAVLLALAGLPATADTQKSGTQPAASTDAKAAQRAKDFEHELVQGEGVNHPREIVKDGKPAPKMAPKPTKKTQRDLDLEHEMVQGEGVNHPRQKMTDKVVAPVSKPAAKTQRDLDHEHEQVQSEGVRHPREVIKK